MKNFIKLIGSALILVSFSSCMFMNYVTEDFSYQVSSRNVQNELQVDTVRIINIEGDIIVSESSDDIIYINGYKRAYSESDLYDVEVSYRIENTTLVIESDYLNTGWFGSTDVGVVYKVQVPAGMRLTISNITGDVRVTGGYTVSSIVNTTGDISVSGNTTLTKIKTVTGNISADMPAIYANAEISAVTGDVRANIGENFNAGVIASAVTGDVRYWVTRPTGDFTLRLSTTTGDVIVE